MSDFLFCRTRRQPGELAAALSLFLHGVDVAVREEHGPWGSLAWSEATHEPTHCVDDGAVLTLLPGSPLVRSPGLAAEPSSRIAARQRVHEHAAATFGEPGTLADVGVSLDGHFALLSLHRPSGALHLITDRFAFVPVFTSSDADGAFCAGTHVDAVARVAGRAHDIDAVSIADLCAHESVTPPHTMYGGVWQMGAGEWQVGDTARGTWWTPREHDDFGSLEDAAVALRKALMDSVAAAIPRDDRRAAVLLSGGEDSRAVLGAVPGGVDVHGFTYAEWESREVRVARAAARAYGAAFDPVLRDPSHYAAGFADVASLVGSYHSFLDVHGHRIARGAGLHTWPVVLGGLSADSLLKACHAGDERRLRPLHGVRRELLEEVAVRRRVFHDRLRELRPRSADEWMWLWPWSLRKHGANLDGNRRMFRTWEAFHAAGVLHVATGAPVEWKLDRRLFRAALRPLLRRSWFVPHANYRFPWFGRAGNALLLPGLAVARGVGGAVRGELRRRHRPWPKWHTVLNDPAMQRAEAALLEASPLPRVLFENGDPAELLGAWYSRHRLLFAQLMHAQGVAAG